jgi:hypothetical protein
MRKKLFSCFIALSPSIPIFSSATPSLPFQKPPLPFSSTLVTQTFFGHDLDILNNKPHTPYSLFQYIYDFGIQSLNIKPNNTTQQSLSIVANARMKGIFGQRGSGLVPLQETRKFEGWMKELFVQYMPLKNKNNYLKGGFFPFKVGNGFVLGNAYDINIPISWQYIYEQINQFRPGILLQLGNQNNSISASTYVGFIVTQNAISTPTTSPTVDLLSSTALFTVNSPSLLGGSHNIVTAFQMNFGPFEPHHLQLSPYVCLHSTNQYVEFPDDATSKLYTPGIALLYENNGLRLNFEVAKNFGHQHVKTLDRNRLIQFNGQKNTQLFYAPQSGNPFAPLTTASYTSSPFVVSDALAASYGNGGTFRYAVDADSTYTFKNSYDRYRKSYTNRYAGFLIYFNAVLTKNRWRWAMAAAYASGANSPNDSIVTLFLTRLTPGVTYKDYNKTYKGFLGTNQFSEASSINALYFGPGNFRYTNFAVLGTTGAYTIPKEHDKLITHATWVSYFKPTAQRLDITNQTGTTLNTPLPHYLGTEFNGALSYRRGEDLKFSLLGGIFFPGKNYHDLKEQISLTELQIAKVFDPTITSLPTVKPTKVAFFTSFNFVWTFDACDIRYFLSKNKESLSA